MKKLAGFLSVWLIASMLLAQQTRGFVKARTDAKDHIALIIANTNYPDMPLKTPANDANAVANAFREMGFIVEKVLDADRNAMAAAVERFSAKLPNARAAVFYYAGHGMQVDGENYLIPIARTAADQINTADQVPFRAFNAGEVLKKLENGKVKFALVALDACRNNPIKAGGRSALKGLAQVTAPAGSMIMYSTKAGAVAIDDAGSGNNSPFTIAFLEHIKTVGLDVNLLPSKITKTVMDLTGGQQVPGTYVQVTQSFTFVPELSKEELELIKQQQQGQLTELQKKEAEISKQKALEDAEMLRKQKEIDDMERQITELKNKTISSGGTDDLDKMLAIVEQRKKQQLELDALRKKADDERQLREAEIALLKRKEQEQKQKEFDESIAKYKRIAESEFGQDMKLPAWNGILKKYGLEENSIKEGDISELRRKTVGGSNADLPQNLALIPAGTFTMGSPSNEADRGTDETQHQVTLSYSFLMGKYEVSQGEYSALMGNNPSNFKNCGTNCPVEKVSWFDAIKYCNALSKKEGFPAAYNETTGDLLDERGNITTDITKVKGYRLPTEAEWEYAARGGTQTPFSTGGNLTTDQANYNGNYPYNGNAKGQYRQAPVAVNSFSPNAFGLYNMHGNVWEWCNDWDAGYSAGSQTNPVGAATGSGRVYRGGSWSGSANFCRAANRGSYYPSGTSDYLGFRIALAL